MFPEINGISQLPFAIEATFGVGPIQVHIDRQTLEITGSDYQTRFLIPKPMGAPVSADTFLDPHYAPISAIWAVDIDESLLVGQERPMVVVHNPLATNPVAMGLFPAHSEYLATDQTDQYQVDRIDGTMASI